MEIKIKETNEVVTLEYIKYGMNIAEDVIGNAGAKNDGQFTWCEDESIYLADQDTVDWWAKYLADQEATDIEVDKLATELGIPAANIWEEIEECIGPDYDMHRSEAVRVMGTFKQ